jgi:hypothetical protein
MLTFGPSDTKLMKIAIQHLLAGLLLAASAVRAAPLSITVSPTTITNNYVGTIQLSISNLSSAGVTVRVDRFLDVNSNGIVDANKWAGQAFYVTDGQEPIIGGVRNSNVPGDDDGLANQSILTHVPYPSGDMTVDHISGQYIYRVTDLGNGQTATAIMGIAQQVLSQGVKGQVFTGSGTPLANVAVVVSQQTGNDGFGTVSDSSGNFTIYAPPEEYQILTVASGQVANPGVLAINSNSFASFDLTNSATDGTTISGTVTDSSSGAGLPGIAIQAQNNPGQFVYVTTGTNGAFNLLVNSNKWTLKLSGSEGSIIGYCRGSANKISVNTSSGSVSNVNFQMIKGNALVYGNVMTTQSNPVVSLEMDASDTNNSLFDSKGITDANGNYSVALVAGGDEVGPDNSSLTGFISPQNVFFTINSGQAVQENFVLQPVSAYISGIVEDNFGSPLGNTQLYVDPTNDQTGSLSEYFQSAPDGTFSVGVGAGVWNLTLSCGTGDSNNLIGEILTISVANGASVSNVVLVAQHPTATIYGKVTDSSGSPLTGVNMFAGANVGGTNYNTGCVNTDSNGNYSLPVFPAEWSVGGNYQGMTNATVTVTGTNSVMLNFVVSSQPAGPSLGQPFVSGGQVQFQVTGNNFQGYAIEAATNLNGGWQPIYTNYGSFSFTNAISTNRWRFYRAVAVP